MELFDTHCHLNHNVFRADFGKVLERADHSGVNLFLVPGWDLASSKEAVRLSSLHPQLLAAVGIHPSDWQQASPETLKEIEHLAANPRVVAIGEIGLDKVSSVSFESQLLVFKTQLKMAEKAKKPVLLHAVRSMPEIIEIKKQFPAIPLWIIHGFRGGKQAAEQYLKKGFYLSFGPRFNKEGLLGCPIERLFLETDDSGEDIGLVYEQVAQVLDCSVESLEQQIERTFNSFFMK